MMTEYKTKSVFWELLY